MNVPLLTNLLRFSKLKTGPVGTPHNPQLIHIKRTGRRAVSRFSFLLRKLFAATRIINAERVLGQFPSLVRQKEAGRGLPQQQATPLAVGYPTAAYAHTEHVESGKIHLTASDL